MTTLNKKEMTDEEIKEYPWTLSEIEEEIKDVYLIIDVGIIPTLCAAVISNRIKSQASPVWILILAGSSGGKSIMLNLFSKCGDWIIPIDTLTTSTFASALKRDHETSLLHKMKNGVMFFKDFTVLTTMNEETLREIMGQFRAIFDGSFNKKTGNDVDIDWQGKVGCIAAGTIEVQRKMRQFSQQGERFLNYIINTADSKEITYRAMKNQSSIKAKEEYLQKVVASFINQKITSMLISDIDISDRVQREMIEVANFCTLARSPVIMNKKNDSLVEFVPSREEPPRMATMLKNLSVALLALTNRKELDDDNAKILYKIGLDSIPVERRLCLKVLSEYRNSNTQSIAAKLHYPTETVTGWLNQLNALRIVDKQKDNSNAFVWEIREEYREIMVKYLDLEVMDVVLDIKDTDSDKEVKNAYMDEAIKQANKDALQLDMGYDTSAQEGFDKF